MERRNFLKNMGTAMALSTVIPAVSFAGTAPKDANKMSYKTALDAITNGKAPKESYKVKLKTHEIAENGAVVPVTVNVESPMTDSDYVKSIHILSSKNGNSRTVDVNLTPANGKAMFSTRIKLNGTQNVVALVEMSNGDFLIASQSVKVTIGGCG